MRFSAVAARGTEPFLAAELTALGATEVHAGRGVVRFEGSLELGLRAVVFARVPSRILLPITTFYGGTVEALYEAARAIPWNEHLTARSTFSVECVASSRLEVHTHYAALRTKDAIVDQFRDRTGERPSVDTRTPDLRIHVHLDSDESAISVDLGQGSLHRRGYRPKGAAAPLKENLAASMLYAADWPRLAREGRAFVDPMCGTGTLLVEAAFMATDTAPGLFRGGHTRFGWLGHDAKTFARLLEEARGRARKGREALPTIVGFDRSEEARSFARESLARADVRFVTLEAASLAEATPPREGALVMVNPPYGDRLGEVTELVPLYEKLGDVLKQRFAGSTAYVITGSPVLATHLGLRPSRKWALWNGPIECRLLELPIEGAAGKDRPAWRRASPEAGAFKSRLTKNLASLTGWAKSEQITCYRVYDADVPEYNLAVDRYGDHVVVQEYAAPYSVDVGVAARRVRDALHVVTEVLDVPEENVVLKVRKRQTGGSQYERTDADVKRITVQEGGLTFPLELSSHLDTGLFPDHRKLRAMMAEASREKRFLNLFAYTCTASVYAARAGAVTTSVDLSGRYLAWGREIFAANGLSVRGHRFLEEDCLRFASEERAKYDVIFSNPPTYSRSHRMDSDFSVLRDHVRHLEEVAALLAPGGVLFFSTHAKGFELDAASLPALDVKEITRKVLPRDFLRSPFRAYRITREG